MRFILRPLEVPILVVQLRHQILVVRLQEQIQETLRKLYQQLQVEVQQHPLQQHLMVVYLVMVQQLNLGIHHILQQIQNHHASARPYRQRPSLPQKPAV